MEQEAANADEEQDEECSKPYRVMLMLDAIADTSDCEADEEEIGECINELGDVIGRIVILFVGQSNVGDDW